MEFSTWILFAGVAFISTISPGPAVLLSVTNSLTHGFGKSIISSLGNIFGILVVSGATALGLGAVLKTSALLFSAFKIVGAVYLVYLGIRQLTNTENMFESTTHKRTSGQGHMTSFVQGMLVALSNPKAVLFFTALFPQFLDLSKPVAIQFAILTSTFMVLSFFSLLFYAKGAWAFKTWFSSNTRARWFNRISGLVFITFGLGILRLKNRAA